MDDADVSKWQPMIAQAAKTVCGESPDSDFEDMVQAIWVELLYQQSQGKLLDWRESYAQSAIFYIARNEAFENRRAALVVSSQYSYRTADVRKLLETFFDRSEWANAVTPDDASSELGNVGVEMSSDLSRAWDRLLPSQQVTIFQRFGLNQKVSSDKLSKAIARMADIINEYQPVRKRGGPGARKPLTNTRAAMIIEEQTNGR